MLKPLALLLGCIVAVTVAAPKPDFTGTYQEKQGNRKLRVVQTDSAVEVTVIPPDTWVTSGFRRIPLDGSEGEYRTETGRLGKCKAHLNKDSLELQCVSSPAPSRFVTHEEWRLSRDSSTLTRKVEIENPGEAPLVLAFLFPTNPRTETYVRTNGQ